MRVGVGVGGGGGINVNVAIVVIVGTAACVSAIAVWIAFCDGAQAAIKIVAKHKIIVVHILFILFPISEYVFPIDYYRAISHSVLM